MRNYDFAERGDLIEENIKLKEEIYLLEGALSSAENKLEEMQEILREKNQQIIDLRNKD